MDEAGVHLENASEALRVLRERAEQLIQEAARRGVDARSHRIRLRDDEGTIHFEGTLAEAAKLRIMSLLPLLVAANVLMSAWGDAAPLMEIAS